MTTNRWNSELREQLSFRWETQLLLRDVYAHTSADQH